MQLNGITIGLASVERDDEHKPAVIRKVMGDGTVRVRKSGPDLRFISVKWPRLTKTYWDLLWAYLGATGWGAQDLTLTDDYGETFTVRYWGRSLKGQRRLGRFYSAEATFLVLS